MEERDINDAAKILLEISSRNERVQLIHYPNNITTFQQTKIFMQNKYFTHGPLLVPNIINIPQNIMVTNKPIKWEWINQF